MHVSLVLLKLTVFITLLENVQFKYLNSSQKLHAQIYNKTLPCRAQLGNLKGRESSLKSKSTPGGEAFSRDVSKPYKFHKNIIFKQRKFPRSSR